MEQKMIHKTSEQCIFFIKDNNLDFYLIIPNSRQVSIVLGLFSEVDDEMVKNFSEDPGSQSNPEGYVFTDGEMVDEFDDAVKSLKPGEVTLCESEFGYHVVKRLPLAENDEKLKELFEQYKETVRTKKAADDTKEAITKMAEEAGITVETVDSVIESIASPEPTEEAAADTE